MGRDSCHHEPEVVPCLRPPPTRATSGDHRLAPPADPSARGGRAGRHREVVVDRADLPGTRGRSSLGVITNDIYTDEDARFLRSAGVLDPERIRAVETGACPHTAIRDDVTANLLAVEDLEADFAPLDLVLVESGGDNLTATFSPALVDAQIFVLDVAGGGDVARKGGPGIGRADLLVVNKTDLGPYVGVDVPQMVADGRAARDGRPVIGLSRLDRPSIDELTGWLRGVLAAFRAGAHVAVDPGPMAPHSHSADEGGGWPMHSHSADGTLTMTQPLPTGAGWPMTRHSADEGGGWPMNTATSTPMTTTSQPWRPPARTRAPANA